MLKIPARKVVSNLLITTSNDVWAYYRVPLVSMTGRNFEKQDKHKESVEQFLRGLSKYQDIEIFSDPVSYELEERLNLLSKEFSDEYHDLADDIAERTVSIMNDELGFLTTERQVIGVRLNSVSSSDSLKGKLSEVTDEVVSKVVSGTGYILEVDESFVQRYSMIEEMLFQRFGALQGERLTSDELLAHINYPFVRGKKEALESKIQYKAISSLTDSILDTATTAGLIEIQTGSGVSYASILPIHKFDKNVRYNHINEKVSELPFPVETMYKGRFMTLNGARGIKGKRNRANRKLKNGANESYRAGEIESNKGKFNRYILQDLEEKIEEKEAFIKWFGAFVVTGTTKKECISRRAQLIDYCESLKVEVVKGLSDQDKLFHFFLPGQTQNLLKNWTHYMTCEGLSEMMFGVDSRIGDRVGFPIGRISNLSNVSGMKPEEIARVCRKVVMLNPTLANQPDVAGKASSSPHIAITGPTGGGKSFLAKLIFFYCTLLEGKGLYIDPKSEYKEWLMKVADNPYYREKYPLFVSYIESFNFVTLDADKEENRGVLDPLNYLTGSNVQDTLETIFEQVYDFRNKEDARTNMLRAIKEVVIEKDEGHSVGMMTVVDKMIASDNEETQKTGRAIFERVDGSVLELAFSDGSSKGLDLTSKVTILEVAGLDIPKATEDIRNYNSSQRKSVALMMCLGKFCEQFGLSDRNENTFVLIDEAWIFSSSDGGRKIIKSMRRIGRTFSNMMVLITQSINDTKTDDDSGNFGRIFAFDNPDERPEILGHIGLEVNDVNIEWLQRMPQYHCLYLDIYGRVGRMLVYCPFEEVLESFRTVDRKDSAGSEEMFNL